GIELGIAVIKMNSALHRLDRGGAVTLCVQDSRHKIVRLCHTRLLRGELRANSCGLLETSDRIQLVGLFRSLVGRDRDAFGRSDSFITFAEIIFASSTP